MPKWAASWLLMQRSGVLEFVWSDNGGQQPLPDRAWLVLLDDGTNTDAWCAWYTDEEFRSQFEVEP